MSRVKSPGHSISESQELGSQPPAARFLFSRLSLRQRLPLLIGTLLLGIIIASIWASYRGVKDSALEAGHERLRLLSQQLVTLLQQGANTLTGKTIATANDPAIRSYLHSPESGSRTGVVALLQLFAAAQDPNSLQTELWDARHSLVLTLPENSPSMPTDLEPEFRQSASGPSFSAVGTIRIIKETVTYPLVAAVKDEAGQIIGYLVRWRRLAATAEARQQLLALIGTRAEIYMGNVRGDVWTNLLTTAPLPPENVRSTSNVTHYTREGGIPVAAIGHPISGTPWLVVVEFPLGEITAQADQFLRRIVIISLVLFALGLLGAWALSRSITGPLHALTEATSAISGGDYSGLVEVKRGDELGKLASSFNTMVVQVRDAQQGLERNVQQRTAQLEEANRELEAFSYSVSHDLRAPLRAVDGFSRILEEDYADKLDDEGRRVLGVIRSNAQNMGHLIDDLLAFSRLGRTRLETTTIGMSELAGEVYAQLEANSDPGPVSMNIMALPDAIGDRAMIRQVFANLLSNALKYSGPKDAPVVEVGGRRENGENIYYVRDNGVGFDKQYANKLFGVFQRLHSAEEFEGTGVGLAIVQRIIHRHGGRVWADGEEGKGATFYFTLPLEAGEGRDGELHGHQ